MSKRKLFVLSMDAMVSEDVDYLLSKKDSNFSRLFSDASGIRKAQTIYPSLTYPAHVSMMTGCYVGRHGITANRDFTTEENKPLWVLDANRIKVDTVFTAAKRAGLSTASVYWPVTGYDKDIDYLIAEYFFTNNEPLDEVFRELGANDRTLRIVGDNASVFPPEGKRNWGGYYSDFITGCCCSLIREVKPDVLLAHNCLFDTLRHLNGLFNDIITDACDEFDRILGVLVRAMEDAGTFEDTDIVITSDHGQRNYVRKVGLNTLLRRAGFIDVDENNKVTDYRAFVESNGMSAYVFLKDPDDKTVYNQVYDCLRKLSGENLWGFHEVLTRDEAKQRFGLDGDFAFIVESDNYSYCGSYWTEPVIRDLEWKDYRYGHATHGYFPEKGPQPVFWCRGPSFRKGVVIEKGRVIDEAPTLAATFEGTLPEADGRALTEILNC